MGFGEPRPVQERKKNPGRPASAKRAALGARVLFSFIRFKSFRVLNVTETLLCQGLAGNGVCVKYAENWVMYWVCWVKYAESWVMYGVSSD